MPGFVFLSVYFSTRTFFLVVSEALISLNLEFSQQNFYY
jgi:hypothetical protein